MKFIRLNYRLLIILLLVAVSYALSPAKPQGPVFQGAVQSTSSYFDINNQSIKPYSSKLKIVSKKKNTYYENVTKIVQLTGFNESTINELTADSDTPGLYIFRDYNKIMDFWTYSQNTQEVKQLSHTTLPYHNCFEGTLAFWSNNKNEIVFVQQIDISSLMFSQKVCLVDIQTGKVKVDFTLPKTKVEQYGQFFIDSKSGLMVFESGNSYYLLDINNSLFKPLLVPEIPNFTFINFNRFMPAKFDVPNHILIARGGQSWSFYDITSNTFSPILTLPDNDYNFVSLSPDQKYVLFKERTRDKINNYVIFDVTKNEIHSRFLQSEIPDYFIGWLEHSK